ncbi:MAG: alpha/beta hydrolase [Chloroflexi bacterium AL-W]|nr:alpha/beta hydrolase [Chloroflexi bacterium AL-N1]NOK66438.1 alpha/beta hydrolase [Chloroflexi bacterium AL-N10]NOK71826.1 alpha/beta hydrolase [Chloroflexi bacterium AL-N5]NOK81083.1 alpha/beta hydrolase [Chloroflexi bacterium AL-W]NOK89356.1 alpha/beta hydrolase [Chloroflexi bacterium AL-N15]
MIATTYIRHALFIGVLMLVLGACGQPVATQPTAVTLPSAVTQPTATTQTPAVTQTPTPGAVPAGLERFYTQELTFGPCADYAITDADAEAFANDTFECARLDVPLDYQNPDGRTVQIALLRVPAWGEPNTRIGSLLLNPGGPGFAGMSHATDMAEKLSDSPVTERFDLIGFDPRGVGASTPALDCWTDAELEPGATNSRLWGENYTEEETRQLYAQCAERSGGADVLAHVGTRDVVRDMDVLRAVLGDEQLTFVGYSYGTRLGTIYAETFPQNVRALVLDAPVDPTTGTAARRLVQFEAAQQSFERFAAFCAQSPDCPLGTDPAQATAVFHQLVQPLLDEPITTADGRTLTHFDAVASVLFALNVEGIWPVLIQGIAELEAGRGDTLMAVRDAATLRSADGSYTNGSDALTAINCLDEERYTPEQETAMMSGIYDAAPFMDTGRPVTARNLCEHWPVQPTLTYPYAQNIEGLPQTLVVAATRDSATPYTGGISLAEALGASLLTVEGSGHGVVFITGNACVDTIAADYLINLELPADGATCTL